MIKVTDPNTILLEDFIIAGLAQYPIVSPPNITDSIVDVGTIFRRKSNTVNIIICDLIPCDECWSINKFLINKVNDSLKCECFKNGFVFIVQDHGWNLTNGSLDCSLFY